MKSYIKLNIKYLREKENYGQDVFGNMFDVSKDVISTYESGRATPKLHTIQKICSHFDISIDDFINRDLRDVERGKKAGGYIDPYVEAQALSQPGSFYAPGDYIESLKEQIAAKDEVIAMQRDRIKELEDRLNEKTPSKRQAG